MANYYNQYDFDNYCRAVSSNGSPLNTVVENKLFNEHLW